MIYPTRHTDKTTLMGDPVCDRHSLLTYDICHAVDTLAMSGILERMVECGMHPNTASIFKTTSGAKWTTQLSKAAMSLENNGLDIVMANDVSTKSNMVLTCNGIFEEASREHCLSFLASESLDLAE